MKKFYALFATLLISASLLAGGPGSNDLLSPEEINITVTPAGRTVNPTLGSTYFDISGFLFSWTATESTSWLSIRKLGDRLYVDYIANPSSGSRTAKIKISSPLQADKYATVTQLGTLLAITPTSRSVGPTAGLTTFSVSSNVPWTFSESYSWIKATNSGSVLTVSYQANSSIYSRVAYINIRTITGRSISVSVQQKGNPSIAYVSYEIDDDNIVSSGDGDGKAEPGETIEMPVTLRNSGGSTANNVSAILSTTDSDISITDNNLTWVAIAPGASIKASDFDFKVSSSCPSKTVKFKLDIISFEGTWTRYFDVPIYGPSGVLDCGSAVNLTCGQTYNGSTSSGRNNVESYGCNSYTEKGPEKVHKLVLSGTRNLSAKLSNTGSVDFQVMILSSCNPGSCIATGNSEAKVEKATAGTYYIVVDGYKSTDLGNYTLTISCEVPPISVTPSERNVGKDAGSTNFTVSSAVVWGVSDDAPWLSVSKTSSTNIKASFQNNTSTNARTALITVSGPGVSNKTVKVIQAGAPVELDVSPNKRDVGPESGSTSFSVSSNVSWTVSDDASWLTASKDGSSIGATYDENQSTSPRTATIKVTGGGKTENVEVVQAGADPKLNVSPSTRDVSSEAGSTTFSVSSNISWTVSEDAAWLNATKDGSSINVSYDANPEISPRSVSLMVTGGGKTELVKVTQEGKDILLKVSPTTKKVGSESGSTSFIVEANVDWTISDDVSWLIIIKDGSAINVSYSTNTGVASRSAIITVTGGGITETVTVVQEGVAIHLTVSPLTKSVTFESGSTAFSVDANVDWNVSDDASWLTATKTDGNTVSVSYDKNSSTDIRTAIITLKGTGLEPKTVSLTQNAEVVVNYLTISSTNESCGCDKGSARVGVGSNVDWSVSSSDTWLQAIKEDEQTLVIKYDANTTEQERMATIRLAGGGISKTITVVQAGANPTAAINLTHNQEIIIYPNPASDRLFIRAESKFSGNVLIAIFDIKGNMIHSQIITQLEARETISIDLSSFKHGMYFLKINNSIAYRFEKL